MTIVREAVYAALWSLASAAPGFAVAQRRVRHWSDVSPVEQPFLCLSEKGGTGRSLAHATPIVWRLNAEFLIYARQPDQRLAPAEILNPLVDALEAALAPSPVTGVQTLGLAEVRHVYVSGRLMTDEGILGDQAVAVVPVEILAVG